MKMMAKSDVFKICIYILILLTIEGCNNFPSYNRKITNKEIGRIVLNKFTHEFKPLPKLSEDIYAKIIRYIGPCEYDYTLFSCSCLLCKHKGFNCSAY